jgi:hypothetical protein
MPHQGSFSNSNAILPHATPLAPPSLYYHRYLVTIAALERSYRTWRLTVLGRFQLQDSQVRSPLSFSATAIVSSNPVGTAFLPSFLSADDLSSIHPTCLPACRFFLLFFVLLACLAFHPLLGDTGAVGVKFDELLQGYFSAGGELFMPIPDYEAAYATVTQSCCNSFSTLT